jgi:hypothetical protein
MSYTLKYKKLFEVKLLHDYYLDKSDEFFTDLPPDEQKVQLNNYDVGNFLHVSPAEKSVKLMRDHRLIFKNTKQGFVLLCQLDNSDNNKPFIALDDLKLTFLLQGSNNYILNFTSLPLSGNAGHIYYYSNLAGNSGANFPSLSLPMPAFAAGDTYLTGDMVMFGGQAYLALQELAPATADPGTAGSGWLLINDIAYTSTSDRLVSGSSFYNFQFPNPDMEIKVEVRDMKDQLIYQIIKDNKGGNTSSDIDLRSLISGKYHLNIKDTADNSELEDLDFYLNNDLPATSSIFGVIEIFVNKGSGYHILNASGAIKELEYEIRFKNRLTNWRYIAQSDKSVLLETDPNPFTHSGYIKIKIEDTDMPNPEVDTIKEDSGKIISEIYVNQ